MNIKKEIKEWIEYYDEEWGFNLSKKMVKIMTKDLTKVSEEIIFDLQDTIQQFEEENTELKIYKKNTKAILELDLDKLKKQTKDIKELEEQARYWEAAAGLISDDRREWIDKVKELEKKLAYLTKNWNQLLDVQHKPVIDFSKDSNILR